MEGLQEGTKTSWRLEAVVAGCGDARRTPCFHHNNTDGCRKQQHGGEIIIIIIIKALFYVV